MQLSGLWNNSYQSNGLTKQKFVNGYGLFCFSLTQNAMPPSSSDYQEPGETGRTRLYFRFSTALNEPFNLVVYGTFQSNIQIDKSRVVTTDYTAGAS